MQECIDKNYSITRPVADILNPFSGLGIAVDRINKKSIKEAEKRIRWHDLDDRWGGKEKAVKMRKTVVAGKAVSNVTALPGAAATGFLAGADGYCTIQCRGRHYVEIDLEINKI